MSKDYRRAAELIHDALDVSDSRYGYHNRLSGDVDITSDELAAALLDAGWQPPADDTES